ncbi:MAG: hypothetical protein ACI37J_08555 [Candidatus Bruticola sp.]
MRNEPNISASKISEKVGLSLRK